MVNYHAATGYSAEQIAEWILFVAHRTDLSTAPKPGWFLDTLLLLRMNLTWDGLAAISDAGVGEREHRRRAKAVFDFCSDPWAVDLETRFNSCDDRLPWVTCIVDGFPVPCRATGGPHTTQQGRSTLKNYSGKYRIRCWKMELFTDLQGTPLFVRGPLNGKDHDRSFALESGPIPFVHDPRELVLADSGYFGVEHYLLPLKKNDKEGDVVLCMAEGGELVGTTQGKPVSVRTYWNKSHSIFRSRVERRFAWWERWRFTQMCSHGPEFVRDAFKLIVCLEHYFAVRGTRPYNIDPDAKGLARWENATRCQCTNQTNTKRLSACYAFRRKAAERLWHVKRYVPVARAPQKRARSEPGNSQRRPDQ